MIISLIKIKRNGKKKNNKKLNSLNYENYIKALMNIYL